MKVTIIGTGYVGLITGVCLAKNNHDIICVDNNENIVNDLNAGKPHFYEDELNEILNEVIISKKFNASNNLSESLSFCDIVMIAVGTPSYNGDIDLSYIKKVSEEIGSYLKNSNKLISVVVKSTVIPGTTINFIKNIIEFNSQKKIGIDFGLGMNPEFLREGNAIHDFLNPDRIVIGFEDKIALDALQKLYEYSFVPKILVNTKTAEMIKYVNNCFLATQISLTNEIANLTSSIGDIDYKMVLEGVHTDKRWSIYQQNNYHRKDTILSYHIPGCGFGGSCFPKDVEALTNLGKKHNLPMSLLDSVLQVNNSQPNIIYNLLESTLVDKKLKSILFLGLSFKVGTDDVRESPALKIIKSFLDKQYNIYAHDPISIPNFTKEFGENSKKINFIQDWKSTISSIDVIIIITNWLDYNDLLKINLEDKVIFDTRRMFNPIEMNVKKYFSIGLVI